MSKKFLINYVWQIWTIGSHFGVAVDVAFDIFMANVKGGQEMHDNAIDVGLNWAEMKAEWVEKATHEERQAALEAYKVFVARYYDEVCEAFNAKDEEAVKKIVAEYKGL